MLFSSHKTKAKFPPVAHFVFWFLGYLSDVLVFWVGNIFLEYIVTYKYVILALKCQNFWMISSVPLEQFNQQSI